MMTDGSNHTFLESLWGDEQLGTILRELMHISIFSAKTEKKSLNMAKFGDHYVIFFPSFNNS